MRGMEFEKGIKKKKERGRDEGRRGLGRKNKKKIKALGKKRYCREE